MAARVDPVRAPIRPRRGRRGPGGGWMALFAIAVSVVFALPLLYLIIRNLADPGELWRTMRSGRTLGPLVRSLALAASVSGSAAFLGTLAAWLVERTDLPARRIWRLILPLPLVVPSFIGAFALLAAFAPGGLLEGAAEAFGIDRMPQVRGFWGAFAVLSLFTYPYVYMPVAARLRRVPRSLEEAARQFGRGPVRAFFSVVLPQIAGAVLAGTLLVFLYAISDFGAVQLLRYDTLTRAIYETRLFDRPVSLALSLVLAVLAIAVVGVERIVTRRARELRTESASDPLWVPLRAWRIPALGAVVLIVSLALFAPIAVLGHWAVRGLTTGTSRVGSLAGDLGGLAEPAVNTAVVGLAAAGVAVLVLAPVAYLTVRRRSRAGAVGNAVVVGGFALPGLPIALALAFFTLRAPGAVGALYQSYTLLVLAYLIHFGALSLRASQIAVGEVPPRVEEAARSLGAGRLRRLWTVDLPLIAPGVLAGAGLVLLNVMKELPATLLLAPPGFRTLATETWAAAEEAFLADASVAALVLVALSGILTWLLVVRRVDAVR